ncbi:MAG: hypothetical protein AAB495_03325 [Patescibacteria group bacterium]
MIKFKNFFRGKTFLYIVTAFSVGVFYVTLPLPAEAIISVSRFLEMHPAVVDLKGMPRDILGGEFQIRNIADHRIAVYPFVYGVEEENGVQKFLDSSLADQAESLANWISLHRGVIMLDPGEEKKVQFNLQINLRAEPGFYHAVIGVGEGATRDDAEQDISRAATLAVNVEVISDVRVDFALKSFRATKTFLVGSSPAFSYRVLNNGNRPEAPRGELRIYNRRGKEISFIPTNTEGKIVSPGEEAPFSVNSEAVFPIGRHKAFLDVSYGEEGGKHLTDTAFFWVFPLIWVFAVGVLFFAIIIAAIALHYIYERRHRKTVQMHPMRPYAHDIIDLRRGAGQTRDKNGNE